MRDVIIREIEMPYFINAFVKFDEDGIYNLYINSNLPKEKRDEALEHEIKHIEKNHLTNESEVEYKEKSAIKKDNYIYILFENNTLDFIEKPEHIKRIMNDIANEALK